MNSNEEALLANRIENRKSLFISAVVVALLYLALFVGWPMAMNWRENVHTDNLIRLHEAGAPTLGLSR